MSRIAILGSRGFPSYYGGFETLVRKLAPDLVDRGHEVVVYGRGSRLRSTSCLIDGVEVRETAGLESKSTSTLSFGFSASIDLARNPCDVALILNVANGFWLRRLARARIATCVNVDGLEWLRGKWGYAARQTFLHAAAATARDADALVVDSLALGEIWRERFGRESHFIPYGASVLRGERKELLREHGLHVGGYVLAVARLVPENNVDLLLDCLPLLPPDVPVIVVGDANYEHPTVHRLKQLNSEGRVTWLGHLDDQHLLEELWMNADVYWHGHSVGGTNPALLQALGAGAPTLALDTPFNREVIRNDFQLVPRDPQLLAERISQILSSTTFAKSLREKGQATVAERYTWEEVCAGYEELLVAMADRRAPRSFRPTSQLGAEEARKPGEKRRRRGRVVAVVGPDGAGKSRLTADLQQALTQQLDEKIAVVNFRSRYVDRLLRHTPSDTHSASTNPHGVPSRGAAAASLKAIVLWIDLLLSAWSWRRPGARRLTLVERYVYDLVVDPGRLGLTYAPKALRDVALRLTPPPDAVLMCQAPASVLHARKAELTESEIARQYGEWHTLRSSLRVPFIDVDTTEPVDTDRLTTQLLAVLER